MLEEQVYLTFKTLLEMLEDRGLTIISGIPNYAYSQFLEMYKYFNNYSGIFNIIGIDERKNRTIVHFVKDINHNKQGNLIGIKDNEDSKSSDTELITLYNFIKETNELSINDTIIFVICYGENLHNSHIKLEENLDSLQIFHVNSLLFNITKHQYVPKHELLNKEEIENIKKKLNINSINQLPVIHLNDPIAKYLNMKVGNVCRIYRPSPTTKVHICYRVCMDINNL
jgi:DNA-directed RNA polymerase I, II, and III subunit RPABC1